MDVRLVVEQGRRRLRVVRLRGPATRIGRARGSGVRIPSAEVSRQHCVLRVEDGLVTVEDLDSVNGTFLNGEAVVGCRVVRPGDRLHVGPVTFVVEYELAPEALERLREDDADYDYEIVEVDEGGLEVAEEEALPVGEEFVLEDVPELALEEWQATDDEDAPPSGRDTLGPRPSGS
jgi:pSer/pThr/pTyr-binding forkhead associated (FHA) protein